MSAPARTVYLRSGETVHAADVSAGGEVRLEGQAGVFRVESAGPGVFLVTHDGRQRVVHALVDGRRRLLFLDGRAYDLEVTATDRSRREAEAGADAHLAAAMPATVLRLAAGPGDRVEAGQTVVVLEAMKMELPLRAPRDGVVRAVHCREGDLVQAGVTLLEIE